LTEFGFLAIGFSLGVLLTKAEYALLIRDLLDRISWRNPSDYYFMTYQRKNRLVEPKPWWKSFWQPKKKEVGIPVSPEAVQEQLDKAIEDQVNAQDAEEIHRKAYVEQQAEIAKSTNRPT